MALQPNRLVAAAIAGALTLLLAAPTAWAETPGDAPSTPGESGTQSLADRLAQTAESGITDPDEIAAELSLPAAGGGSLEFDEAGAVLVTVMFDGAPSEALLADLAAIATIEQVYTLVSAASVRIDATQLESLQALPGIASAMPALQPFTGADLRDARSQAPISLAAPADDSCRAMPVEADDALGTDLARALFDVDGTGVTIGVISDSFALHDLPTSWQDDVLAGALPGPGNPCGYETAVEVLLDRHDPLDGSDEGRAMAQLVHGIAPGAKILFADAGASEIGMAESIATLAIAGADIIVDDITWPTEGYFQMSYSSRIIEMVKAEHGVAYFSSAGNSTTAGTTGASDGVPISSWQTKAYRPMACPDWVETDATDADCLDFDPSEAEQAYDLLTVDESGSASVLASIGEPLGGISTSYEVHFYEEAADPLEAPVKSQSIASFGGGLPGLSGSVEVQADTRVRMVVVRTGHDVDAPLPALYVGFLRGGEMFSERQFLGDGVNDVVGSSAFGHGGDGSATSVASLKWDDPVYVRPYSSLGPNTLLFEPVSLTSTVPSPPYDEPVVVESPQIAAVDGVQTTFFGDPDKEYRFFGTSAAAPIAAAALALGREYAPSVDSDTLTGIMLLAANANAVRPVNPYADAGFADSVVFGAGLIDAPGMLRLLPTRGFGDEGSYSSTADSITVHWSAAVGSPTEFVLELYDEGAAASAAASGARLPDDVSLFASHSATGTLVQSVTLPGTATSHTFTGLQPNRVYSVVLTAQFVGGGAATPTVLPSVTTQPAAPAPGPTPPVPTPAPGPGEVTPVSDQISHTGAEGNTLLFVGAGVLVLAGLAALVVSLVRRRSAAARHSAAAARLAASESQPSDEPVRGPSLPEGS